VSVVPTLEQNSGVRFNRLVVEAPALLQLVREALQAFEELRVSAIYPAPGYVIDLRDWEKTARTVIARVEGQG
jgi:hypothetical protein